MRIEDFKFEARAGLATPWDLGLKIMPPTKWQKGDEVVRRAGRKRQENQCHIPVPRVVSGTRR